MKVEHWAPFPEVMKSIKSIYTCNLEQGQSCEACMAAAASAFAMNRDLLTQPSIAFAFVEYFSGFRRATAVDRLFNVRERSNVRIFASFT